MGQRQRTYSLVGTIYKKASETFPMDLLQGPPDALVKSENWALWEEHYLRTAEKWRQELESEGLIQTALAVQRIIADQRALIER